MTAPVGTAAEIPPHFELLRDESGFGRLVGPLYIRKPGEGRTFAWGFRAADKHLNPGGVVHGGMLVTFADQCFGALAWFAAGRKPCTTIDLSASFRFTRDAGRLDRVHRQGQPNDAGPRLRDWPHHRRRAYAGRPQGYLEATGPLAQPRRQTITKLTGQCRN